MITFSARDQESSTFHICKKAAFINGHGVTALLDTGSTDATQPVDSLVGRPLLDLPLIAPHFPLISII
ncbi:hypothetical protein NPIL_573871 [Nephila pilipes]|uniref:Uncharacterized protein n=1 Tax=Nephila pilipes TaxID=299642 RepID=A0A8X6QWP7_NEPPI|nr:hypothetical protein NPIL_573871 [Nephila pilipes]